MLSARFPTITCILFAICTCVLSATAQDQNASPEPQTFPKLEVPETNSITALQQFVKLAKSAKPGNGKQYEQMQTAIQAASRKLLKLIKDKESSEYQQAELDIISSSVLLMTFVGEDAKKKTVEQIHSFLKTKKTLTESDVQTGIMAAAMLELQPNKKPARDTYELLDSLLEDDEREAMQSLRLNLKASIRKLNLLGSKFELKAKSINGQTINIDDYAGKFVVVDFFATWCQPCLVELPRLKQHYAKYQSKGLEVIGVSLDDSAKKLQAFLDDADLPWPIIHDSESDPLKTLQMRFGIAQLPTVLLLNKEGTVVSLEARGSELNRLVQKLFDTPTLAPPPSDPGSDASDTE